MAKRHLADIFQALNEGGCVRFKHLSCDPYVVFKDGSSKLLDGRSYQGFLQTMAKTLNRTETGSLDTHNLVIEWRR